MPNISFDIFFDQDFINVTATRGKTAPKAKPEWKVRSAPKLPPKEQPVDRSGAARPPGRPKINEGRGPIGKPAPKQDTSDAASQTGGDAPRRKPPKLGPRKKDSTASAANGATQT
jgi:hypothetical protein